MGQFAIDLLKFANKAGDRMDLAVRKTVLEIDSRVVQRTPVDTGRAQNNWNVAVDKPDLSVTDEGASQEEKLAEAAAAVSDLKAGGKVYITNNLPYIEELEKGSSTQAPNGMVDVTLNEFQNILIKASIDAKKSRP